MLLMNEVLAYNAGIGIGNATRLYQFFNSVDTASGSSSKIQSGVDLRAYFSNGLLSVNIGTQLKYSPEIVSRYVDIHQFDFGSADSAFAVNQAFDISLSYHKGAGYIGLYMDYMALDIDLATGGENIKFGNAAFYRTYPASFRAHTLFTSQNELSFGFKLGWRIPLNEYIYINCGVNKALSSIEIKDYQGKKVRRPDPLDVLTPLGEAMFNQIGLMALFAEYDISDVYGENIEINNIGLTFHLEFDLFH